MAATLRSFNPGAVLFREGEPSKSIFLIKKGTVAIRKLKAGAYIELAKIRPNEILGELAFFDRAPRSATAVAITEVEALEIDFDSLDAIYMNVPDYMKAIIASVVERLRKANDTIRRLQKNVVSQNTTDPEEKPDEKAEEKKPSDSEPQSA